MGHMTRALKMSSTWCHLKKESPICIMLVGLLINGWAIPHLMPYFQVPLLHLTSLPDALSLHCDVSLQRSTVVSNPCFVNFSWSHFSLSQDLFEMLLTFMYNNSSLGEAADQQTLEYPGNETSMLCYRKKRFLESLDDAKLWLNWQQIRICMQRGRYRMLSHLGKVPFYGGTLEWC